jgi:2-phospho-L-lactate guanylyltransferase
MAAPATTPVAFSPSPFASAWALVPTKELELAKSRLAPLLEPTQRRDLVHVMLVDVLRVLLAAPGLAGVAVVGRAPSLLALAASQGALVLHDESGDLNGALAQGAAQLAERGARALLVLPGDVPLVAPADIVALLELGAEGGVAIAPSRDGGTNALALPLPAPIAFRFGVNSCAAHAALARTGGLRAQIYRSPALALDIDTADDLCALEEMQGAPATHALLRTWALQPCI